MPDPLATSLSGIRADAEGYIIDSDEDCTDIRVSCLGHNALRVVAALEAVLKLADDDDQATRFYRERSPWTIKLREAISAALLGDADDG